MKDLNPMLLRKYVLLPAQAWRGANE
jgi:hypothetical protein